MACGAGTQRTAQTKKQAYARRAKRIFRGAASSVPSRSRRSMTSRSADGVRSRHTARRADEKTGVRPKGEADFSRSGKQCAVAEPPKQDKQKCGWRAEQAYSAPRRRKNRRTPEGRSGFFAERQAVCRRGAAEA